MNRKTPSQPSKNDLRGIHSVTGAHVYTVGLSLGTSFRILRSPPNPVGRPVLILRPQRKSCRSRK